MEYNTSRNHLEMREYGRHIQKMVEYLLSIEDRERRQKNTQAVIEIMGILNPHLRNVEDFKHLLWDHLFLVSDFKLDVDSPYPIPTRESLKQRPPMLEYPKNKMRWSHLGKNLERVVDKALAETNEEKRAGFTKIIGNYMKLAYSNWHKEPVHDDMVKNELNIMTQGELAYEPQYQRNYDNPPNRNFKRPQQFNKPKQSGGGGYGNRSEGSGGTGGGYSSNRNTDRNEGGGSYGNNRYGNNNNRNTDRNNNDRNNESGGSYGNNFKRKYNNNNKGK